MDADIVEERREGARTRADDIGDRILRANPKPKVLTIQPKLKRSAFKIGLTATKYDATPIAHAAMGPSATPIEGLYPASDSDAATTIAVVSICPARN